MAVSLRGKLRATALAALSCLSLTTAGQPASARPIECAREADSIRKAESRLPRLEVAPPEDWQIVCITR